MSDSDSQEKSTVQEAGARGGKARAKNMTPEQRREAARRAAEERWKRAGKDTGTRTATHTGELRIGELIIPCAVLEDGTRVLSETGVVKALGLYRSGAVQSREKEAADGGAQLPLFVANKNIKQFVDKDLANVLTKPIWYIPQGSGTRHKGVKAELIPRICDVWLKARDNQKLRGKRQDIVAVKADIITRALAHVGITALVDEATGYQDDRPARALTEILEKFVREEIRRYVSAFPLAYFRELCRLRDVPFSESMKLPRYFGYLTNDLIYSRLAPGVLAELQRRNPSENGRRKNKHYWWLTE